MISTGTGTQFSIAHSEAAHDGTPAAHSPPPATHILIDPTKHLRPSYESVANRHSESDTGSRVLVAERRSAEEIPKRPSRRTRKPSEEA
jgi:hypothetical protein